MKASRSHDTPVVTSTASVQILISKHHLSLRGKKKTGEGRKIFKEISDSKSGIGKRQSTPQIPCCAKNPGGAPRLVGTCQEDTTARLKGLSLARFEHQNKITILFNNGTMCRKIYNKKGEVNLE